MKSELRKRISCPLATRLLRVVFGFYLVVVICSMIGQMVVEYRYQKNSIRGEFSNIQTSFGGVLAGAMWNLDEKALRSTVEGMIELPVIVGMKIADENGKIIALGGMVNTVNGKGETGIHVHLQGCAPEDVQVPDGGTYRFELFEGGFPIIYLVNQQPRVLGQATIYSSASIVIGRVKVSFLMLGVKAVVEIVLLWLIFKVVFVRLLKRPLAELTTAVERVTLDNLDAIKVGALSLGRDELGLLAESFNKMLLDLRSEIAKRKIADENLAASEAKLNSILSVAPAGIGLTRGRVFTAVNPAMCELTGYDHAELLGQSTRCLYLTEEEYIGSGDRLYSLIDQHGIGTVEVAWHRKDGQRVEVLLSAAPLVANDRDGEITFVAMNLTERKRAEAEKDKLQTQLTQAQKMESVGRLAGGVAHDFNNMLQVILGNAALALQDQPKGSPMRESLEEIEKSARRSADLTRQLLAFARKQTIAPKVLDLNDTVAGMLKMLRRLIGEDIELAWIPGANLWPVKMDTSQIDQILANLCVNARDAIEGVGTVKIETTNATLDDTCVATHPDAVAGDYVMLTVSDTGKGMDAETRSHLFEPFFTTKELGKGTGLGLATVYGIVKQNQGFITIHSEPDTGSVFRIYLPRCGAAAPVAASVPQSSPPQGQETILLVEDELQILAVCQRTLQRLGYSVLTAGAPSAAAALAAAHAGTIHLLLTDLIMPTMNGHELLQSLRKTIPGLRCVFMSGYAPDTFTRQGIIPEGVHFLAKPFTAESLAATVRAALEQPA
jgi:PAS domain S-box-containing protein